MKVSEENKASKEELNQSQESKRKLEQELEKVRSKVRPSQLFELSTGTGQLLQSADYYQRGVYGCQGFA